jgi:hypothetical protein
MGLVLLVVRIDLIGCGVAQGAKIILLLLVVLFSQVQITDENTA